MPRMSGFGFFEKRKINSAVLDAKTCLNKALTEAFGNNDAFQKRADKYFGGSEAQMHLIMKTINSMKVLIGSDSYRIVRGGDQDGTNAEAENIPQREIKFKGSAEKKARTALHQGTAIYAGKVVNVVEAITQYASANAAPEITLYDLYFKLPYKLGDNQSQVETFLHELSHTAAGTHDVDAPKCYGYNGVVYCRGINKGASNAESYGMFLQSYLL